MDIETLVRIGFSEIQAKIYLYLVEHGLTTPSEIAKGIDGNRTTVYSALERLTKLGVITQKSKGKITAFIPNHPSVLESLAEKRLRQVAREARNLESALPTLINYYNEHQDEPGVATFYGREGVKMIYDKIVAEGKTFYYVRSRYDEKAVPDDLKALNKARIEAKIQADSIIPFELAHYYDRTEKNWGMTQTFLPPNEYDSPVEIDIFGDNVAFINYEKDGMSTLIESPEIADAMRQFFLFAKKHVRKSKDYDELINN